MLSATIVGVLRMLADRHWSTDVLAGALIGLELWEVGNAALGWDAALAALLSFAAAFAAIAGLMRMMRGWSMTGFALYRFALGAVLLWVAYG